MPVYAAPSQGSQVKWGVDSANPITKTYEFISEAFGAKPEHTETGGIRGTRSRPSENVVLNKIPVDGPVEVEPVPSLLSAWGLQAILGGTPTGSAPVTYPLGETVPAYFHTFDRIAKVFTYAGVKVNKATFRSSEGQNLRLGFEFAGLTETVGAAGTFPAIPAAAAAIPLEAPFQHESALFTFNGVARNVKDVEILFDNHLDLERYLNSLTRTALPEQDRTVSVTVTTPFTSDETDLYLQALQPGVGGTVVYTNGTKTLTFTFAALQAPVPTPSTSGKVEIPLKMTFMARMLGATREVVVTM